ncbi:hypothetical protein [Xylanimonas protaetiae]|uniref:Uncharacterized protein n=1 Tax=Xylanimonas protaetiae TaxID=2509457 RepID=A0A4P6F6J1_9MICO|nr:hypothetical protein [Xylanimonas protaetiae]QAY71600.1 hypothetical protein ET471_17475 [Xylanimonas protaetiae]
MSPATRVLVDVDAAGVPDEPSLADLSGGADGIVLTGPADDVRRAARRLDRAGRAAEADAAAIPFDPADRPGTATAYPGAPEPPTPVTLRTRLGLARPASRYATPTPSEVTR